jgi:hypothetical protein
MHARDYNAIAARLRTQRDEAWHFDEYEEQHAEAIDGLARSLADYFEADNPRFDRDRFLNAATGEIVPGSTTVPESAGYPADMSAEERVYWRDEQDKIDADLRDEPKGADEFFDGLIATAETLPERERRERLARESWTADAELGALIDAHPASSRHDFPEDELGPDQSVPRTSDFESTGDYLAREANREASVFRGGGGLG